MSELSHVNADGTVRMVDVAEKDVTQRVAIASGRILLSAATLTALRAGSTPKGDPLEAARIAGIMAAKKTPELIPLCHQVNLSKIDIKVELEESGIRITAEASANDRTGVEMEALTAVSVAALTIYDMCKAVQKDITITDIQLDAKTGGKADYSRSPSHTAEL
jgi:cyclic pyranopterin monophosphate synthase